MKEKEPLATGRKPLPAKARFIEIVKMYRSDYQLATMITSGISAGINIAFVLFNGAFGLLQRSVWHLSVFVYYVLLLGIRGHILVSIRKKRAVRPVYIRTHLLFILMNLSMILPIAMMVNGEREYDYGLIPAIAMAAYTTYRITMASIHMIKSRSSRSPLVKELRAINFVDSLVALMSLQNTLIMAKGGMTNEMKTMCAWTNGGMFFLMLLVSVRSFFLIRTICTPGNDE